MSDLDDDIRASFEQHSKEEGATQAAIEKLEPVRDEAGKFTKEEKVEPEVKDKTVEEEIAAASKPKEEKVDAEAKAEPTEEERTLLAKDKAPSGWVPKLRERWAEVPPDIRQEILRREEASAKGVQQLQEQFAPAQGFVQALMPFIQEAANNKQDPTAYFNNVMQSERRLRVGTDVERFQALVEIAEGYGIPLRQTINDALGREVIPPINKNQNALPREVQQELEEARRFRQQYEQQQQSHVGKEEANAIAEFSKGNEFFEDVRDDMALLIESGRAKDLKEAYDQAVWVNPHTREIMMERQKNPVVDKVAAAQAAATKVKVKSSNSSQLQNNDHDDDDDLDTTLRKAWNSGSGRV